MSKIIVADDSSFDDIVIKSNMPVLVEFGANWCGPCQRQLPILEKISNEYENKIKVVKIDIDEANNICSKYYIRSVPTMIVFNNGEAFNTKIGLSSESDVKNMFNNLL